MVTFNRNSVCQSLSCNDPAFLNKEISHSVKCNSQAIDVPSTSDYVVMAWFQDSKTCSGDMTTATAYVANGMCQQNPELRNVWNLASCNNGTPSLKTCKDAECKDCEEFVHNAGCDGHGTSFTCSAKPGSNGNGGGNGDNNGDDGNGKDSGRDKDSNSASIAQSVTGALAGVFALGLSFIW